MAYESLQKQDDHVEGLWHDLWPRGEERNLRPGEARRAHAQAQLTLLCRCHPRYPEGHGVVYP